MAERGVGEIHGGREPQQSEVVVDSGGDVVRVLKFPAIAACCEERACIVVIGRNLFGGPSLLRYSNGDALIRTVPARHTDNCVDGGCAVPEILSVLNISSGNIGIYSPPRLQ